MRELLTIEAEWSANALRGSAPTQSALDRMLRGFLVLDPLFPRSMLGSARGAVTTVRELEAQGSLDTSGSLLRTVGMLQSELEFSASAPSPQTIDAMAESAMAAAGEAGAEVSDAFFRQAGTIVWSQ